MEKPKKVKITKQFQKIEKIALDASFKLWTLEYYLKDPSYWSALTESEQGKIRSRLEALIEQLNREVDYCQVSPKLESKQEEFDLDEPDDFPEDEE